MTSVTAERRRFPKYEESGAYHWIECDRRSRNFNPPLVARYDAVVRRVAPGSRVLDLGCGDGYLTHLLSRRAESVTGLDPEAAAVRLAGELLREYKNCRVLEGSCYDLPFPDGSFDVAVMADVIEHLEDDDRSLQELARVLSPTGEAIITTPRRRPERPIEKHHVREYSAEELLERCTRHFRDVEIVCLWPVRWSNAYRTRIGWRLIRELGRYLYNPFLREGTDPENFAQLLAWCRRPASRRPVVPVDSAGGQYTG